MTFCQKFLGGGIVLAMFLGGAWISLPDLRLLGVQEYHASCDQSSTGRARFYDDMTGRMMRAPAEFVCINGERLVSQRAPLVLAQIAPVSSQPLPAHP